MILVHTNWNMRIHFSQRFYHCLQHHIASIIPRSATCLSPGHSMRLQGAAARDHPTACSAGAGAWLRLRLRAPRTMREHVAEVSRTRSHRLDRQPRSLDHDGARPLPGDAEKFRAHLKIPTGTLQPDGKARRHHPEPDRGDVGASGGYAGARPPHWHGFRATRGSLSGSGGPLRLIATLDRHRAGREWPVRLLPLRMLGCMRHVGPLPSHRAPRSIRAGA